MNCTELQQQLNLLKVTPPWIQGGRLEPTTYSPFAGDEGSRAPDPGDYDKWQLEIAQLEAEIAACQEINRS